MGQIPSQVQSPFLWVDDDDQLYMRVWGAILTGCTALLTARILRPSGVIEKVQLKVAAPTNRTVNTGLVNVGRGWLLSIIVLPSAGQPERGQVFINVLLIREGLSDADAASMFISDYLCYQSYLGYPGGMVRSSIEGPGRIRSITGTDPAAGEEISETVPLGARWRLRGIRYTFAAAVAVATRYSSLIIDDGTNILRKVTPNTPQTSGVLYNYSLIPTFSNPGVVVIDSDADIGEGPVMLAGYRIRTETLALQAADNYSAPQLFVEEWLES